MTERRMRHRLGNGLLHGSLQIIVGHAKPSTASAAARSNISAGVFLLAMFVAAGCSAPERVHRDVITVEGVVTARGNEPFVRYVLETPEGNYYALRIPDEDRQKFETPARLQVTGRNYVDEWDGRAFAHIDVAEWARLE